MNYQIKPFGDRAMLIEYPAEITAEISQKVLQLKQAIEKAAVKGISFLIPAYCSLTIGYEPTKTSYTKLHDTIHKLVKTATKTAPGNPLEIEIPVCYEAPYALDMEAVSTQTGLSAIEIIELHQSILYRVYMIGFLPGFPYLGLLPKVLEVSRKAIPRKEVAAGSVALAGRQTGIYPSMAPGGWQIIGRTPVSLFDPQRVPVCLVQAGDQIRFRAISASEFAAYEA